MVRTTVQAMIMSNRKHVRVAAAAVLSAIFLLCLGSSTSLAASERAAVINKDVAHSLTQAKQHAERKQWRSALAVLREAEASPGKSPYAEYKIEEFKGLRSYTTKKVRRGSADLRQAC